jgi:hypothetical protein
MTDATSQQRNTANNSNEAKKETLKEEKHIVGYQLDATLKHSSARSVASSVDFGILSKRQPEKEASDSIRGNSSSGKRLLNKTGSQNNSPKCPLVINVDDDDDSAVEDVLLVGEACKPLTCHPINIFRLSAEREVSRKINTATKINPKSKVTITRDIGRTFVLIDADDNNGQRPTRRNANTGPSQRPITSHSAFQSTEATPQTKREQQFVINHDKGKLIDVEDHHRGMQRLQELRRDFYRIAEDVFKEVESHHRAGGVAAATSNPLSYLTKPSTSASILPTLQRSESNRDVTSNRATTADGLNSCKCPVLPLKGAGIHTAEGSTKLDPSLHRNKAERTESASSSSRCSPKPCLPVELDNGTGAGSEEGTAKAVKREFSETVNLAKGPIRLPRPFKMCKTHDGHEAIDLAGSE